VGTSGLPFDQMVVDWGARLLSGGIGMLAVLGFWRFRLHHSAGVRRSWNTLALLAFAALPAAAANSYGGEIIFRVFMFALPFLAVAAAAVFFPWSPGAHAASQRRGGRRVAPIALVITCLLFLGGFALGNYGKDAMNYFTPGEVAAAKWLYRTAPRGAQIVAPNSDFPWAFTHYDSYSYTFLDTPPALGDKVRKAPVSAMVTLMQPGRTPASYLILTTSQAAEIELTGMWPAGAFSRISHELTGSGLFRVVYRNTDAVILELAS
jgi:hypothetical protein